MRLIDARDLSNLKLVEVVDETTKDYAILSHRWEEEEVGFLDMQISAKAIGMKGFKKIQWACEQAREDGYEYLWVDTCCIDKRSSAELTEAINSMYRWYKASSVCYAFLSDVNVNDSSDGEWESQFKSSKWFTRGWTLQELLAPSHVVFYDEQWSVLCTKRDESRLLAVCTGIDEAVLKGEELSSRSIAQRMSWASSRQTTRGEDIAYCLLGIFDINMPMLYGEGKDKAFLRLQEEIIKRSDDHTIFAWPLHRDDQHGLLADSPVAFVGCNYVLGMTRREGRPPYSITNRGLSIKLMASLFTSDTYLVRLDCTDQSAEKVSIYGKENCLGLFLRRLDEDDQYARVKYEGNSVHPLGGFDEFAKHNERSSSHSTRRPYRQIEINVRQFYEERIYQHEFYEERINGFRILEPALPAQLEYAHGPEDRFTIGSPMWDVKTCIMSREPGHTGTVGFTDHKQRGTDDIKAVRFGFDFEYNPICMLTTRTRLDIWEDIAEDMPYPASFVEPLRNTLLHIHKKKPSDNVEWSQKDGGGVARELESRPGCWAVKGDRIDGVDVRIMREIGNSKGSISYYKVLANLKIRQEMFEGRYIWTVRFKPETNGPLGPGISQS